MTDFLKITETTDITGISATTESIKSLSEEKAKRQQELDAWYQKEVNKIIAKSLGMLYLELRKFTPKVPNNPGEKGE